MPNPPRGPLDLLRRRPFDHPAATRGPGASLVGAGVYVDGKRVEPDEAVDAHSLDAIAALHDCARKRGGFVWLGLFEPTEAELGAVARVFGLHPLAVEDAAHPLVVTERPTLRQRPKLDRYGDSLFLILKTCVYVEHTELTDTAQIVDSGDLMVFCGPEYVITVRHGRHLAMGRLRERLEADPVTLALGPAVVMHALADHVVDVYLEVADEMQTDLDELENGVFAARDVKQIDNAYHLKRELLELRAAVLPLATPLRMLSETEFAVVPEKVRVYFRDVLDHLDRVRDSLSSLDELLSSITQACVARVAAIQNEDNRRISAWVAIAAVPTVIAGIYGMNFDVMPELRWRYGYPAVLVVMLSVCTTLYFMFKRKGWL